MINFLHTFNPEPILFSFGPFTIYWYGFFIVLGIISAIFLILKLAAYYPEAGLTKNLIIDMAFWCVLAGLAGARIYDVLLELPYYLSNPLDVFKIWQGGLAIHGAIIGGALATYFFAKKNKLNFRLLLAIIAPAMAFAQGIGRWGNYFNQELFGLPTNLSWGIPIGLSNRPVEYLTSDYFHPTFLYESIGNFLIFIILMIFHIRIIKKQKQKIINYQLLIINCYLILYSILRFSLEFIRIDRAPDFLGLRFPQIASLIIFTASIIMLLKNKKNYVSIR